MRRTLLTALLLCVSALGAAPPYRFLLVISDQWKDPAGEVIEGPGEFAVTAGLMKAWGLPFDVLRLDQQRFDRYYLFDREGRPRYGTIVWDAGPRGLDGKGVELLESLVREHGLNLVALGDTVAAPPVAALTGVEFVSEYSLETDLAAAREHYIGAELRGGESAGRRGDKVTARDATVLVNRGALPFLAVREQPGGGRVVWIDAHRGSAQIARPAVRALFRRALVWAQGYALFPETGRSVVLEMHDPGASDKAFLPYWHYRNLTEQEVRERLITPLQKHNARLAVVVNTGYVDRRSQRVLNPWTQERVLDELDGKTVHDYASLKRGLDAGQRAGVFEIQSHGWTHMLPDLDSPPGPFWDAPLDGVATLGWDNEFGDRIRNLEIPAAVQRQHMELSLRYLARDFGVTPLFIRPGGGLASLTWDNHTGRIAAQAGFGLTRLASPYYLARDVSIALGPATPQTGWAYNQPVRVPWSADGPVFIAFHDRDVALDAGAVERLLSGLGKDARYITPDEYCGYLHAQVTGNLGPDGRPALTLHYDPHYCRWFAARESAWTLHVPGKPPRAVRVPPGTGAHTVD